MCARDSLALLCGGYIMVGRYLYATQHNKAQALCIILEMYSISESGVNNYG